MPTKITNLTPFNVTALEHPLVVRHFDHEVSTTATTASWDATPWEALTDVKRALFHLERNGHPRSSLHAVVRKLRRLIDDA